MDPVIQALYSLPILGLIFQFVGYLIFILPPVAPVILQSATPVILAALCGVLCERSGVVNIGIEGIMLTSAFVGWIVGVALQSSLGTDPGWFFGITPALAIALAAAIAAALLVSALHAWLSITVKADQIISGTIINIAAFGVTGYLYTLVSPNAPPGAGSFTKFSPPPELSSLPAIGWLFDAVLAQGPITITALVAIVVLQVFLFRSRWGLRTRAVGEHPKAAETVGIDVIRLRYRNVIVAGTFAGLGGAFLSMEATNTFVDGMTAGRGFIGLAAMIVGRWTPLGAFGAALVFASSQSLGQAIKFAPPPGDLGTLLGAVPGQFFDALPYIVTVIILAGFVGRSTPPAADGQPYEREATA